MKMFAHTCTVIVTGTFNPLLELHLLVKKNTHDRITVLPIGNVQMHYQGNMNRFPGPHLLCSLFLCPFRPLDALVAHDNDGQLARGQAGDLKALGEEGGQQRLQVHQVFELEVTHRGLAFTELLDELLEAIADPFPRQDVVLLEAAPHAPRQEGLVAETREDELMTMKSGRNKEQVTGDTTKITIRELDKLLWTGQIIQTTEIIHSAACTHIMKLSSWVQWSLSHCCEIVIHRL